MKIVEDVAQGSDQWLQFRAKRFGSSEAAAMLGLSAHTSRAELLRMKYTGLPQEFSDWTQRNVLDKGHAVEAAAREIVEARLGEPLYPVVCHGEGNLVASCDGLTLDEDTGWECKQWNEALAAEVVAGRVPDTHMPQCQHQLLVTGAKEWIFSVSDGTPERTVSCKVLPSESWFQRLRDGWALFERDLAAYVLPDALPAAPVGRPPETLPALRIEVSGQVTASNLAEFKQTALATIRGVNRELRTDQHFADAERAIKWCSDVESRFKAAKEHALSQTASIDALFKALDDIGAEARTVRLDLDKLVARRKTEVKEEAVAKARKALDEHIARLHAEIAPFRLPAISADFAGCIKGLKSVASMQDKLDGMLATAKIAAEADARAIRGNVTTFKAEAGDYEFLFSDLGQLIHQPADSFKALVQGRIAQHKVAEAERERKKREAEELALQQAEARRLAAEAEAAAQIRAAQEAASRAADVAAVAAAQPVNVSGPLDMAPKPAEGLAFDSRGVLSPIQAPRADEPATLKLGDINERLAPLQISAAGLVILGIHPAATKGTSKLYRPSDYDRVLRALAKHIDNLQAVPA